ncbi:MAG: toll/interleukin-1 receptor domain-containing protein [Synergistaceae bacterium]|nr:toll/interleukin-1 receptor domain-containing protein [Synergistaceae bacterium]
MDMDNNFKYYAFISYSHKDMAIAKKLQKSLESYHLPAALIKSHPDLPKKINPVFMDESNLVATGTLKTALQENLERSNYLIVICSPNSEKSEYVNDEVEYFIKLGRVDKIIPVIIDGVPHSDNSETECFTPAILNLPRDQELLGIDLKKFGTRDAFIRVIATLLKLDIENFVSREARARRRRIFTYAAIAAALLIIAFIFIPKTYDEFLADNVMQNALAAYKNAGEQYERLSGLNDCAIDNPDDFKNKLALYKNNIFNQAMMRSSKNSVEYLDEMMKTGDVMPWSRQPMRRDECAELLTLAISRDAEYKYFAEVLEFVMSDDYAKIYYSSVYPGLLREILEIDADIAAALYQAACSPHFQGKYADNSVEAQAFKSNLANVSRQNIHLEKLKSENVQQALESLSSFKGLREKCLNNIRSCGALDAYNKLNNNKDKVKDRAAAASADKSITVSADVTPETRMLNDLIGYIYNCEVIYKDLKWALEYCEDFNRKKDWTSLQLARASLAIAKSAISRRGLDKRAMTAEDYKYFMSRRIDVNFLYDLESLFKAEHLHCINSCGFLINNFMVNIFTQSDWNICVRNLKLENMILDCDIKYLANLADWFLNSLNDYNITQKFNSLLEQHCPLTRSYQRRMPEDPKSIEADTNNLLKQIKNLVYQEYDAIGAINESLNALQYNLDKKDIDAIRKDLLKISNLPVSILMPEWFKTDYDIHYFWQDENGKVSSTPQPGSNLTRAPDICRIRVKGVSLDDVKLYQQRLTESGFPALGTENEGKQFKIFYKIKNSVFVIIWDSKQTEIFMMQNPVHLVPAVYLDLIK